ncbi:hypothetical protein FHX52_2232 [Humibacillus xanthopallidus]|uniref:DUF1345 domain-containing protein n=1 Tax=Humibacillus xanthopallidus TaxID=412689 RepID=A0A543PYE5_9MICO|nr:hypothetical protein [Humibacillus xanthopallidus]TQN49071.1 hypothetical protein FHX52_2232 [Humibacillus xanthopallidus]
MLNEPSTGPERRPPGGTGSGQTGVAAAPETYVWPLVALVVVILPQVLVPARLREGPPLAVPAIEAAVLLILLAVAAKPGPVPRAARPLVLSLVAVLIAANTGAAVRLVALVLRSTPKGETPPTVTQLLVTAATLLATNIVTFGLLYWQIDGGGPDVRRVGAARYPDFQFPQTGTEGLAPPHWQPRFPDHLYLAFTNVVAFSPTDTLPLTHRVKGLMAVQSMISLAVLVVVLSRVINILPP